MTSLRLLDHGLCGWREARLSRFVTNRTITSRRVIDCYDKSPKSTQFLFHTAYFWICLMFLYLLDFHDWYYRSVHLGNNSGIIHQIVATHLALRTV